MPNQLSQGSAWLAQQQRAHTSDLLTYSRAGQVPIALPVMRQRSNSQIQDTDGQYVAVGDQDFTFSVCDLVIGGQPTLPIRGDRLIVGNPSTGPVYEVLDVPNEGPYRFCDGFRHQVRVHTKFVGNAPITY
jgi:hypothetical protein